MYNLDLHNHNKCIIDACTKRKSNYFCALYSYIIYQHVYIIKKMMVKYKTYITQYIKKGFSITNTIREVVYYTDPGVMLNHDNVTNTKTRMFSRQN